MLCTVLQLCVYVSSFLSASYDLLDYLTPRFATFEVAPKDGNINLVSYLLKFCSMLY